MEKIGINMFTFENDPVGLETHIYITTCFKGIPQETEEMKPEWFNYSDIPFAQMWSDDEIWFPNVFNKTKFMGHYHFAQDQKTLLTQKMIHDQDIETFSFEKVT